MKTVKDLQIFRKNLLFDKKEIEIKKNQTKNKMKYLEYKYKNSTKDIAVYQNFLNTYLDLSIKLSEINFNLSTTRLKLDELYKESEYAILKNELVQKYGIEETSSLIKKVREQSKISLFN